SQQMHRALLAALFIQIPFELRNTVLGLSNLQWTFVLLAIVSTPLLYRNRTRLIRDRLAQATGIFVVIQWVAAFYAPEFNTNAYKAAVRFTAGFVLVLIVRSSAYRAWILRIWTIAAILAAMYAFASYAGLGVPLFRDREFFVGQIHRLSGSFEY